MPEPRRGNEVDTYALIEVPASAIEIISVLSSMYNIYVKKLVLNTLVTVILDSDV